MSQKTLWLNGQIRGQYSDDGQRYLSTVPQCVLSRPLSGRTGMVQAVKQPVKDSHLRALNMDMRQ